MKLAFPPTPHPLRTITWLFAWLFAWLCASAPALAGQWLGACRALGVEAKIGPSEDSFCRIRSPIAVAMGQEVGEKWTAAANLQPTSPKPDRLLDDQVASKTLGRAIPFKVYLPEHYKATAEPYPVIYLLHGAGGDEAEWLRRGGINETMDGLIHRQQIRPAIVVMPSTGPATWWIDSPSDQAETAVMTELLPYVDSHYRTTGQRSGRSIAGHSMGGYGALNLALRHPEAFCAAGILSGAVYDPEPPANSAARSAPPFQRHGTFDRSLWQAHHYRAQLAGYAKSAAKVPMWIVAGAHDHLGIALVSAQLYGQLLPLQPQQAELRIVAGDHEWLTFRDALPDALRYMDQACAKAP